MLTNARLIGCACLLIAAIGWGLNWPIIKIILRDWPPLFARGTAGLFGALALFLIAQARGEQLGVPVAAYGRLLLAATLNVFAWMGLGTIALLWLTVAEGTLLVFTMPLWATLLSWPLRGQRPTTRSLAALVFGMAGTGSLFLGSEVALGSEKLPGIVLALAAAVLFAYGTVVGVAAIPLAPIALTAWQVGLGCAPMVIAGLLFEHPSYGLLSLAGWVGMVYMAFVPMGLCYLAWFIASRRLPPAMAATGMLLTPIVGVLSAAVMIGESIGVRQILAIALTLSGVFLTVREPGRPV